MKHDSNFGAFSHVHARRVASALALAACAIVLSGCIYVHEREIRVVDPDSTEARQLSHKHGERRKTNPVHVIRHPANINHVVLMKLHDPYDRDQLIADSQRMAEQIPEVVSLFCGSHVDIGRSTVETDYDVCLYVGFDTVDAYQRYVDHPAHHDLVARWKPRLAWLRVYDVQDTH